MILVYGKDIKKEVISNLKLNFKEKCKCSHYNVFFQNERPNIYWVIPTGTWTTKDATIYCPKCNKSWEIDDSEKKMTKFYKEVKNSLDSENEVSFNLDLKLNPHFENLSKKEQERIIAEAKKQDDENFFKMLKAMGVMLVVGAFIWIILKLFFIKGL